MARGERRGEVTGLRRRATVRVEMEVDGVGWDREGEMEGVQMEIQKQPVETETETEKAGCWIECTFPSECRWVAKQKQDLAAQAYTEELQLEMVSPLTSDESSDEDENGNGNGNGNGKAGGGAAEKELGKIETYVDVDVDVEMEMELDGEDDDDAEGGELGCENRMAELEALGAPLRRIATRGR